MKIRLFTCCAAASASTVLLLHGVAHAAQRPPLAMAVLALDSHEHAFGARHLASQAGIPYFFTRDAAEALRQPMVLVTGALGGDLMTPALTETFRSYVAGGGIAVFDDGESSGVEDLAGVSALKASDHRYAMMLDTASGDPGFAHISADEERTVSLGNKGEGTAVLTQGYALKEGAGGRAIARFDDGMPAIVVRHIGSGAVYLSGIAYFDAVLRPQDDHALDAGRVYDNGFEPSADVPGLIVRNWYQRYVGAPVIDATPDGLAGALLITHDVDYQKSVLNMVPYARAESAHGVRATYFVQAKTVADAEDAAFFDARAQKIVASVFAEGGDIASHTVAHAPDWRSFPIGTGAESPATYRPAVKKINADHRGGLTVGATVTGEVHVSQERLDACAAGIHVDALRTGYLLINPQQWAVMERYGYRFDSSFAAGEVMTSFPYTIMEDQSDAAESSLLEFPIVLADAEGWLPMLPHIAAFDRILDDEAAMHGVVTTLIHTDVVADKLPTELALAEHARRDGMWIGTMDSFGDFWTARERTSLSVRRTAGGATITVSVLQPVAGLTLDFPQPVTVQSAEGGAVKPAAGGRALVLEQLQAGRPVSIAVSYR